MKSVRYCLTNTFLILLANDNDVVALADMNTPFLKAPRKKMNFALTHLTTREHKNCNKKAKGTFIIFIGVFCLFCYFTFSLANHKLKLALTVAKIAPS